jgi:phosphoglycerate dehydrogenase-like enzyme
VLGVSHSGRAVEGFDTVWAFGDTNIPWPQVDCLVIALPLTAGTTNIVSDSIFTALHDAHVIMIGRGATVDFDALHRAIQTGNVRHATIDVYPVEPPAADEWFWSDPNVTMTPHISGIPDPMDPVTSFLNARRALMEGRQPEGIVEKERGY